MQHCTQKHVAIILAAGRGLRLRTYSALPKCLLPVKGLSLLEHHFRAFAKTPEISKVLLVVGYQAEAVMEQAKAVCPPTLQLEFVHNQEFEDKGNTYSLFLALQHYLEFIIDRTNPEHALIFDADLIYEHKILSDFTQKAAPSAMLVGPGRLDDWEASKALVDQLGQLHYVLDKQNIPERLLMIHEFVGEAMGIIRLEASLITKATALCEEFFLQEEDHIIKNWEHYFNFLFPQIPLYAHKVNSAQWIEIDTEEDYQRAQELFSSSSEADGSLSLQNSPDENAVIYG